MRGRLLRLALTFAGVAISVAFTYLAVKDVDPQVFWESLRESEYWWLLPAVAVLAAAVWLRGLRWSLLFSSRRPTVGAATRALVVGQLFNNILPARAGEAIRVIFLHRETGASRMEALATAVAERVYDLLAILLLLFVAVPFLPEVSWLRAAAVFAFVLITLATTFAFALRRYGSRPFRFLFRPLARLPGITRDRAERAADNLVRGLDALQNPARVLPVMAATIGSWLVIALSFWLALRSFDLGLGFGAALLVVIATTLATLIPSLPAAVGIFEAATIVALRPYGVEDSNALSCAVVLHGLSFFPFVLVGWALVHRQRRRVRAHEPQPAAAPSRRNAT